ncbi:MAG: bi-domain-containing oxidoreductase [Chloroflexi bacterium]|nr:bi-domain-containing oxidoreductase [Chloroflexota bacterium]
MRWVVQSYRTGKVELVEAPAPTAGPGRVHVRTQASLVSIGTERYMLEMARKSLLGKALARPDLVRQLIAKAQTEGLAEAWQQAVGRLDTPVPLGYSSAGLVADVGPGVAGLAVGDRVACAGSGWAAHAELASVPANLCVKVPDGVDAEAAAFVALGGIALEAVRMAQVGLGERVVVIGLGLLGQIAVQLLAALALDHGAEAGATDYAQLAALCRQRTAGHGADAVVILAATPSDEPLARAAELCRERGRIVAAGLVGLEVPRKPFYDKELELVVSRAWGPGLYDPRYAEQGHDYPLAYARWTAQRNTEEFLSQVAKGAVRVGHLVTHRWPFDRAVEAYEMILEGGEPYIGVLLTYPDDAPRATASGVVWLATGGDDRAPSVDGRRAAIAQRAVGIGLIGAGQHAKGTLLPALRGLPGIALRGVATASGLTARHAATKFGFAYCASDYREVLDDPQIDLVVVATRHGTHARLAAEALAAGKHVFVEKPLALDLAQLHAVVDAARAQPAAYLMVDFNRRFSPFARWLKERFAGCAEPLAVHCTVNAGPVPPDHWTLDPDDGGGRIVGEVCHFIDLMQYLTGALPVRVYAEMLAAPGYAPSDNVVVSLKMANGAVGSIAYVAGGERAHPRERVEVFGGGAVGVIENFRAATFTRAGRRQQTRGWLRVDRGHRAALAALLEAVRGGGPPPVALDEHVATTLATFAIEDALRTARPVAVDPAVLDRSAQG